MFKFFCIFLSSVSFASDCTIFLSEENLCLDIAWIDGPKYNVYSKSIFTFWKKDDLKKTPTAPSKEIDIYPWMVMPGMEHGGRPVVLKNTSAGVYEVSKIYFAQMTGHWEMRVRYVDTDRRTAAIAKINVELP